MRRTILAIALALSAQASVTAGGQNPHEGPPINLAGLHAAAKVTRDTYGIAHIKAANDHDLYFLQGYVHAQDRLFQMDVSRRRASGTLAELLGPAELPADVQLRTIGIRRAAKRSLVVVSSETRRAIAAYTEGVNAYVKLHAQLPPEYEALGITQFQEWTDLDTMTVAKSISFSLSFGLDDIENTIALQTYTAVFGPGTGATLFSEDLWRSQPFYPASTVPDASMAPAGRATAPRPHATRADGATQPASELGKKYLDEIRNLPFFKHRLDRSDRPGSNQWAISGRYTPNGEPLVANDPHLALDQPSTFYPIHLTAGAADVMGSGFAGVPFVVVGHNRHIAWGATVSPLDVTDVYQEQLESDPSSPSGLSTVYRGNREWIIPIPETYRVNVGNGNVVPVPPGGPIPAATLIVPRRNNGPIVQLDLAEGKALSVQYTGFSGTRELDSLLTWNRARNLNDFQRGLQWLDSGTQNFAYADIQGNIAYFAASEVPLREDLQASAVAGLPPWFIRNGSGGNEWLPMQNPQPGQAIPYEILPAAEMPHLINPPAGFFVNANNDPAGTVLDNNPLNQLRPGGGLYYLNAGYDFGLRAQRITELIQRELQQRRGSVSFEDMQRIQADVVLPDAPYFVPLIRQALARGVASSDLVLKYLASQPGIQAVVARLASWDYTAPTGIEQGYDAADDNGSLASPTDSEKANSVAATLYSVWRGQFIKNTIDATLDGVPLPPGVTLPRPGSQLAMTALKSLLERPQPGIGASGVNFFNALAASAENRRDIMILKSIADALTRLAGNEFALAFGGSTNLDDYLWGKLHRIVFEHPLGGGFNLPSPGTNPLGDALPGFPTDGGFGVVDASNHDPRAQSANEFMFSSGPVNRFVARAGTPGVRAESVWPGGTSGIPGSPSYSNLLPRYLTNDTVPLLFRNGDLNDDVESVAHFVPAKQK